MIEQSGLLEIEFGEAFQEYHKQTKRFKLGMV